MVDGYVDAGMPSALHFSPERRDELATIEQSHFWFSPRDKLVEKCIARLLPNRCNIIELGCGTGRTLPILMRHAQSLVGVEAYSESLAVAAERATGATLLRADVTQIPLGGSQFDLAVALDVLEHVEPMAFLLEAGRLVRDGGVLLLTVPADPRLWSVRDERAGHRCRYTVAQLQNELASTGWQWGGHTYYQFLLYPAMLLSRVVLKGRGTIERQPPNWMNVLFGWLNRVEVAALSRAQLPWGSSIVMWARKVT